MFDIDDSKNDSIHEKGKIMQLDTETVFSPSDKVKVKSYQVGKSERVSRRVSLLGEVTISSFIHQGRLRAPVRTKDYTLYRAQLVPIVAILDDVTISIATTDTILRLRRRFLP